MKCRNGAIGRRCSVAVAACLLALPAVPAGAQEDTEALRREIEHERRLLMEQMQLLQEQVERLDRLERRLDASAETPEEPADTAVVADTEDAAPAESGYGAADWGPRERLYRDFADEGFAKSVPLFGSDWRFSFGGYAKLDAIADFSGTGDRFQFITATIPVEGTSGPQPGSYANLHARETRFAFEMRNERSGLPANRAFIELDFFDESSFAPRLRHAYFQWGGLTAGRTWTTLTETRMLPFLIDFAYGDSLYAGRTDQIRWEQNAGERFSWAAAVEAWNDGDIANPEGFAGTARSDFPLLALRGTREWRGGVFTLGGSLAQIRWDGVDGIPDATARQWVIAPAGKVYLDADQQRHYFSFGGSYGDGAAGNIVSFLEAGSPNAVLMADGSLETIPAWNTTLSLHYEWSDAFSSNLSLAYAELDPRDLLAGDAMKAGYIGHANLIWETQEVFRTGIEYMYGKRENVDDKSGGAHRLQFMTMFSF